MGLPGQVNVWRCRHRCMNRKICGPLSDQNRFPSDGPPARPGTTLATNTHSRPLHRLQTRRKSLHHHTQPDPDQPEGPFPSSTTRLPTSVANASAVSPEPVRGNGTMWRSAVLGGKGDSSMAPSTPAGPRHRSSPGWFHTCSTAHYGSPALPMPQPQTHSSP